MDDAALHGSGTKGPFVWDVAGLLRAVSDTLAARFGAVAVRGEVTGFSRAASGHCYFMLRDPAGATALRCAMFRRAASLIEFAPQDGMTVEVRGRLAVYDARGELQLVVEAMRRAGAGALMEQFLRLKARLEAEGLFDPRRKRDLPRFPRCIGVVTSLAAAALRDVASVLSRRAPHVRVIVYASAVQGEEAPAQLCRALALANARAEADVIVLCRGGGSLEDLWAFNDERVVRAIAASALPVIAGVGHETDVTLADFAADVRAPTPTAAAELAAFAAQQACEQLDALAGGVRRALWRELDQRAQRLDRLAVRLARPGQLVRAHAQRLALLEQRARAAMAIALRGAGQAHRHHAQRLVRGVRTALHMKEAAHQGLAARVQALNPQRVLAAGYALVQNEEGRILTEPAQLTEGATVRLTLAHGSAALDIANVRPCS